MFLVYPYGDAVLRSLNAAVETVIAPHLPSRHPQADFFEHISLPNLCRKIGIDLYHGTFQLMPLRRPAPKTVATIHDMALFDFPAAYSRKFGPYMRILLRSSIKKSDRLVTVSDATANAIVRRFPLTKSKITTIHNGVGPEFSLPIPRALSDQLVKEYELPPSFILFVGNLERKKNLTRLIRAFLQLRRAGTITESLVIVGDRPDKVPPEDVAEVFSSIPGETDWLTRGKSAGVHFVGRVSDSQLPIFYSLAKAVAYPSLYEGFGMPLLEAMSAGVPVLTSTVSSMPEITGTAACLVDPYDVDSIAIGLKKVLQDQEWRQIAVAKGRLRAAELTWNQNARSTEELYRSLLKC